MMEALQHRILPPLTPEKVEAVEARLLQLPQQEMPVEHHFGPGVYVRQLTIPADTLIIGHRHKFPHVNILLKGEMTLLKEDGTLVEMAAPMVFHGKPGRKIAYTHTEVKFLNVYHTPETDVDQIEEQLFEKSAGWQEAVNIRQRMEQALLAEGHKDDREDFLEALKEIGVSPEEARRISENESDLMPMPLDWAQKFSLAASPIEGKGLFAVATIQAGEVIGPARLNGKRTPCGRWVNHSSRPNARFERAENGDLYLVAERELRGMSGGLLGEEILLDYRQAARAAQQGEILCQ